MWKIIEIMTDDIVENDLILVERGIQIPVDGKLYWMDFWL